VDDAHRRNSLSLPGRHLYVLDDHLFGNVAVRAKIFFRGMKKAWARVFPRRCKRSPQSCAMWIVIEEAAAAGLRSLFS
jgi:hypothetical protein